MSEQKTRQIIDELIEDKIKLTAERDALWARETELLLELKESREAAVKDHYAYLNAIHDRDRYREALKDIASHCCHPDCNHQEVARAALGETK